MFPHIAVLRMTTIPLHSRPHTRPSTSLTTNPLPQILHTPAGYALLELQGNFNLPIYPDHDTSISPSIYSEISIGHLSFPDYDAADPSNTAWMKRVHMYVGKHQRLFGEVKKLPKALAIIRRRQSERGDDGIVHDGDKPRAEDEELEIVEIVKYKILFSTRPEPVGTWVVGT